MQLLLTATTGTLLIACLMLASSAARAAPYRYRAGSATTSLQTVRRPDVVTSLRSIRRSGGREPLGAPPGLDSGDPRLASRYRGQRLRHVVSDVLNVDVRKRRAEGRGLENVFRLERGVGHGREIDGHVAYIAMEDRVGRVSMNRTSSQLRRAQEAGRRIRGFQPWTIEAQLRHDRAVADSERIGETRFLRVDVDPHGDIRHITPITETHFRAAQSRYEGNLRRFRAQRHHVTFDGGFRGDRREARQLMSRVREAPASFTPRVLEDGSLAYRIRSSNRVREIRGSMQDGVFHIDGMRTLPTKRRAPLDFGARTSVTAEFPTRVPPRQTMLQALVDAPHLPSDGTTTVRLTFSPRGALNGARTEIGAELTLRDGFLRSVTYRPTDQVTTDHPSIDLP